MNKNIFFALLLSCILPFHSNAQPELKSGSLQIIISNNEPVMLEIIGHLSFKETISENIILSNLIPGEYLVKIQSSQRGGNIAVNQVIIVNTGQRTIASVSRNRLSVRSVRDVNSQPIYPNPNLGPGTVYPPVFLPMSDSEFNQFYGAVKQASFDKDKFKVISAAADHAIFTTEQIRQVMTLFSFDDARLDCAKTMANKVYDRSNLYLLADLFTFSSTKDKYFDFIKNMPQTPVRQNR